MKVSGNTKPSATKKRTSLFQRGYETAREEKKRQDEVREKSGKRLYNLFLKDDGDEAQVRFLTEEPVNFYAHNIKSVRGGNERFDTFVCTQDDDCPFCEDGDRPSYKGAYLVYDKRTIETKDPKTGKKKKIHGQLRLYIQGMRVISQLDRLSSRYGLTKFDYIIARVGKGQNTSYTFDRDTDECEKMTKKEIENLLPEKLRDMYDGTMESLYSIVEDQITMMLPSENTHGHDDDDEDEDDEEYRRREKKRRSNLVGYDDDDEDEEEDDDEEEYEDDDDEEEDEPPRRKSSVKSSTNKPSLAAPKKKSGSSAKKLFKR